MNRRHVLRTLGTAGAATVFGEVPIPGVASERHLAPVDWTDELQQKVVTKKPWSLRSSEAFELKSKAVGDTMAVGVWQPDPQWLAESGRKPGQSMDVVYVLDGSLH